MPRKRTGEFNIRRTSNFQDGGGKFKKGTHWRKVRPHWSKEWLFEEYINKQRSACDIAKEIGVKDTAIYFWLDKHGIKTRTMKETRAIKHWGNSGESNPMFGKRGSLNPNWRGGSTAERQACYSSMEWRKVSRKARKRDNYTCQICKKGKKELECGLELHHIISFIIVEKRLDIDNLVLLCEKCHDFVHSNKNTERILLGGTSAGI